MSVLIGSVGARTGTRRDALCGAAGAQRAAAGDQVARRGSVADRRRGLRRTCTDLVNDCC